MALERGGGTAFPTWEDEMQVYSSKGLECHELNKLLSGSYLSVFVQNVAEEAVGVGEALRPRTLPDTDHAVLLRVQNAALGRQEDIP